MFIVGHHDRSTSIIQKNLISSLKRTQESTERLSSGKRVNKSSDDPGNIGTISKLNAKIGSISEALKNASSAKSLSQIADSGLSEINNLLSRIREIAVQANSSTLTSGDRTSLQTEVDAYLSEIDNITKSIKFNDLKLLDGSIKKVTFMIGDEKDSLLTINLKDSDSSALSLSSISGVKEFTSGRVLSFDYSGSNLAANEIKINGQNALAATLSSDLTSGNNTAAALETAINANSNTHGSVATAFNKLISAAKSTLSMSNTFTINGDTVAVQTSMEDLVTEINQSVSGVTANLNSDNSITLSNTTGNDIVIAGSAPTDAGFTAGTYLGYLKLANIDETYVKIEPMTKNNGYATNTGNISDLANFGFNEVDSSTITTSGLVSSNALTASHDIKINDYAVGASTSSSAAAKAEAINQITTSTNVSASGSNLVTVTLNFSNLPSASQVSINGNTVDFSSATGIGDVITAINNASIGDIRAAANSAGGLEISSSSGADIILNHSGTATHLFSAHTDASDKTISRAASVTFKGRISLTHSEGDVIKISGDNVSEIGFAAQASTSTPASGSSISMSSTSNASAAITSIDTAIDTIANTRADIAASENIIDHRINNLTNIDAISKVRLGKIVDVDIAMESSRLTKSQIINQIATSILAQANASSNVFLKLLN
ncbi:MAG: flagellin [Alphaproteobacteria bacterium]|nr:MAG: flagellin [Alphaproteobacteria bacterium]